MEVKPGGGERSEQQLRSGHIAAVIAVRESSHRDVKQLETLPRTTASFAALSRLAFEEARAPRAPKDQERDRTCGCGETGPSKVSVSDDVDGKRGRRHCARRAISRKRIIGLNVNTYRFLRKER